MGRIAEPPSRTAKLVGWAQLSFFSLNVAWIAVWCQPLKLYFWEHAHWMLLYKDWRLPLAMPQGPGVLIQVMLSFVLSVPLFLVLLLLVRVTAVEGFLRAFAGAFAVVAFPFYVLYVSYAFSWGYPPYPSVAEHARLLFVETLVILACGVLYYLRIRTISWAVSLLVLLLHFCLWAWKAGTYTFASWDDYSSYPLMPIPILIGYAHFYGFPVIGFLSALSSVIYLKLSFDRLPSRPSVTGQTPPME